MQQHEYFLTCIITMFIIFAGAMNFFTSSVNTLISKTMDDTLLTVKNFETARYVTSLTFTRLNF